MVDFRRMLEMHDELRKRQEAISRMRARATDISPKLTGMPGGGGDGKRMEREIPAIVDAVRAAEKVEAELEAMKKELADYLPCLEKWQQREAIEKRYMEGKEIVHVADEIGYGYRHTVRIIDSARDELLTKMSHHVIPCHTKNVI